MLKYQSDLDKAIKVLDHYSEETSRVAYEERTPQGWTYYISCKMRGCGKVVPKTRPQAKFCSDNCRVAATRDKRWAIKIIDEEIDRSLPFIFLIILAYLLSQSSKKRSVTDP